MIKNTARKQDELGRILDSCLELISSGAETVDTVIEQYPEYRDQLKPPLEAAMWLQSRKEVFNPRPGFVQLSQRRLVNRFREQTADGGINETISRIPIFFQQHRIAVQYSALLTLTAVLLFVGYRSADFLVQRSIPGDPLYEAKITREEMQVSLASDQEGETRLRIEFAQRRVIEMQELVITGRTELIDRTLENFEYQLSKAASGILVVAQSDQVTAAQLSTLFEETLRVPVNNFVGIIDANPDMTTSDLKDKFLTLALAPFGDSPSVFVVAETTPTPTGTATFTATATLLPTATFTSTSTDLPLPTATEAVEESLPVDDPKPTNTSAPRVDPTATATIKPTNAPTPTNPPTATQAPTPTESNEPEATPIKTKKPRPTQHPTYRPTPTPGG